MKLTFLHILEYVTPSWKGYEAGQYTGRCIYLVQVIQVGQSSISMFHDHEN